MYDLQIHLGHAAPAIQDQVVVPAAVQPAPILPAQQAVSPGVVATGGASVLAVVMCAFGCWYVIKHKNAKAFHMFLAFTLGVMLAGSFAGLMVHSLSNATAGTAASIVGNIGGGR